MASGCRAHDKKVITNPKNGSWLIKTIGKEGPRNEKIKGAAYTGVEMAEGMGGGEGGNIQENEFQGKKNSDGKKLRNLKDCQTYW